MKKILRFLIFIFLLFAILILLIHSNEIKMEIINVLNIWLNNVLVALVPFYLISNLLINYPFISYCLFPFVNKFLKFENHRSCSIFLLSFICGNPTSSYLVINSVQNNEISVKEGNRLLRVCICSSPLFTIFLFQKMAFLIICVQIFVSCLLLHFSKKSNCTLINQRKNQNNLLVVIDECPHIMLSILSSMLFVAIVKIVFYQLLAFCNLHGNIIISYLLDSLEITLGLIHLNTYPLNFIYIFLLQVFLLTFGGFSIIVQILLELKKTSLSKTNLIVFRFFHASLTTLLIGLLMILFF